ncbi:MAG: helix-turn-helix domain-containing protein [Candidatus Gastranaerophilales bacterium]|nr:helix-turn-helix domain-containing protein [Candidatus Gastranaerophilales bacterium]
MNDSDLELYGIVGRMFREIREERNFSLEFVAAYLQIAPKSLQRYECGERKIKVGTIKSLCTFYQIKYDDFIKEAKLRFGKNLYSHDSFQKEKFPKIMQYYGLLNDTGKQEATKRVQELTEIPRYAAEDPYYVNAAHAIEGATEEEKQHDEDIMDDESF